MNGPPETAAPETAAPQPANAELMRGEQARIALLGVNAWVVGVAVPWLHAGPAEPLGTSMAAIPPAVLVGGVLALARHPARARWLLLAVVPVALAGAVVAQPALAQRDAYGTLGMVVAALSLLAFAGVTAHAVGRRHTARAAQVQPLVGKEPVSEPTSRRVVRRLLLASTALGALALTVVAPSLSSRRDHVQRWGEAAEDATVLAIVLGTVVAGLLLGTLVGPTLRASRTAPTRPAHRRLRIGMALLIAAGALTGWVALSYFGYRTFG